MTDLETLRQAHLLLGQYGFVEEQEALAKAIRIISATARRFGVEQAERVKPSRETQGDRLKRLRERAGLTRGQVADLCGVVLSTVRAHENSEAAIPLDAAEAYAEALGVSRAMILNGAGGVGQPGWRRARPLRS